MEFDDVPEPFEDDLEEFERNQLAHDREYEDLADEFPPDDDSEEDVPAAKRRKIEGGLAVEY